MMVNRGVAQRIPYKGGLGYGNDESSNPILFWERSDHPQPIATEVEPHAEPVYSILRSRAMIITISSLIGVGDTARGRRRGWQN
jgi:hypothetical protein